MEHRFQGDARTHPAHKLQDISVFQPRRDGQALIPENGVDATVKKEGNDLLLRIRDPRVVHVFQKTALEKEEMTILIRRHCNCQMFDNDAWQII